ncbi:MAG: adenosylcobyric acid synthase [Arenicella sp.]|jgi:adenosylcobyric acid synthase
MIQGCTSDAGKTVMVAGLCRVLARQGGSVVPFKPQNMALNSAVTSDCGEIGRAQALQALACGLEPHTDMNPILLKPSSDTGAQVIIHGHAISSMQAAQYHDYKKVAMQAVLDSHARLRQQYSAIIVEGAGSPAEINLRENDVANMGFAEAVDCPVVIVADIDRGGVFAHLVGTLDLLSQSEQDRVVGFIINRFRGDITLLQSGLDWLEERTNKPVLGVIPYLTDFYLDAEDAISTSQVSAMQNQQAQQLNVVVPVLSSISNHTDFDALRMHPNVNLQFVTLGQVLPHADLIILPGSKNVRADLDSLKEAGWAKILSKHLRYGGKLIGICGGYQMLGNALADPDAIETNLGDTCGFGLLDLDTVLKQEKQLRQVTGSFIDQQFCEQKIVAYEIHCGLSKVNYQSSKPLLMMDSGAKEGAINHDNNVLGTYLHGIFDLPQASDQLLTWAGLEKRGAIDLEQHRVQQLDRLADCLEHHLDSDFMSKLSRSAQVPAQLCAHNEVAS